MYKRRSDLKIITFYVDSTGPFIWEEKESIISVTQIFARSAGGTS